MAEMSLIYRRSLPAYFRKHNSRTASAAVRMLAVVETTVRLLYSALSSLIRRQRRTYALYKVGLYWPTWRWLVLGQATEPSRLQGEA